jgi:hypothetical protein
MNAARPFRMRAIKSAPEAPAVMKCSPGIKPLYHWIEVSGDRFQSYRINNHCVPLISDDARIRVDQRKGGDGLRAFPAVC